MSISRRGTLLNWVDPETRVNSEPFPSSRKLESECVYLCSCLGWFWMVDGNVALAVCIQGFAKWLSRMPFDSWLTFELQPYFRHSKASQEWVESSGWVASGLLFATTIGQKLCTVCDVCSCMCVRAIGSSSCHAVLPHGLGSRRRRDCRPKSNLRVTTSDSHSHLLLDEIESLLSFSLCICINPQCAVCVVVDVSELCIIVVLWLHCSLHFTPATSTPIVLY